MTVADAERLAVDPDRLRARVRRVASLLRTEAQHEAIAASRWPLGDFRRTMAEAKAEALEWAAIQLECEL